MVTNESIYNANHLFLDKKKIQSYFLKLNKLDFLIFLNVEFWRPIRAEGRKN